MCESHKHTQECTSHTHTLTGEEMLAISCYLYHHLYIFQALKRASLISQIKDHKNKCRCCEERVYRSRKRKDKLQSSCVTLLTNMIKLFLSVLVLCFMHPLRETPQEKRKREKKRKNLSWEFLSAKLQAGVKLSNPMRPVANKHKAMN